MPPSATARAAGPPRATAPAFALLGAVQVVLILAITMLSPALPAVQRDLGLSGAGLTLVSAAYGLSFSGLLLLGGRLADLYGRRRLLVAGVAVFGAASAASAFAPGFGTLLATRFVQGAGAALAAPSAMTLVRSLYPDAARRARALAVWGGLGGFGATAGTLFSGAVTTWASWRWTFAVPAAVSLCVVLAAPRVLPAGPAPVRVRLDVPGAVLVTAGLSVLSHGLVEAGERAWGAPRVWAPVVAGLLLLVAFVVVELSVQEPLLPLGFLMSRRRAAALGAILVGSAGMSAIFFFLSLYLQEVRSASPLLTSAAFLPFGAAQLAAGPLAARAVRNRGARSVTAGGLVLCAGGLLLLGRLDADTPYLGGTLAGLLLFPVGIACVFSGATVAALEGVRDDRAGLAGGVVNTVMEVGPTVGLAVLVTLAATRADRLRGGGTAAAEAVSAGYGYGLTVAAAVCAGGAALVAYALRRGGPDGELDGGGGGGAGPVP